MAMSVTEYGLVKNSDGSMCFTIRPDDTPFPGVCSLALEESTTNTTVTTLLSWSVSHAVIEDAGEKYLGQQVVKVKDDSTADTIHCIYKVPNQATPADSYRSFSVYAKKGSTKYLALSFSGYSYWTGENGAEAVFDLVNETWEWADPSKPGESAFIHCSPDGWCRCGITAQNISGSDQQTRANIFVYNSNGSRTYDGTGGNNYIYVVMPQDEIKRFATSFVDGSRPKGWFYVPLESLGFDPATDDWVIAYWKKPIATSTGDLTGLNIMSIGRYTNDYSVGYVYWGKRYNGDRFRVHAVQSDGSGVGSEVSLDPSTYFNQWHFEVVLRVGNEIKYYYDGQLKVSLTITDLQTFDRGLYVQGYATDVCNSLYANVLYGKAKDSSGNLVWTDSYIQEVYNARAPFAK